MRSGQDQKAEDAKRPDGQGSTATGQSAADGHGKNVNKKAKEEFPEAPKGPVIGMQDERGGVSNPDVQTLQTTRDWSRSWEVADCKQKGH